MRASYHGSGTVSDEGRLSARSQVAVFEPIFLRHVNDEVDDSIASALVDVLIERKIAAEDGLTPNAFYYEYKIPPWSRWLSSKIIRREGILKAPIVATRTKLWGHMADNLFRSPEDFYALLGQLNLTQEEDDALRSLVRSRVENCDQEKAGIILKRLATALTSINESVYRVLLHAVARYASIDDLVAYIKQ